MALGVKVLYPSETITTGSAAGFLDYGVRFVVSSSTAGKATIRIRALSYDNFGESTETPSTSDPVVSIEISNSADFLDGHVVSIAYSERLEYDADTTAIATIGSSDADYASQCMRITNWTLDRGEGEKKVYVRFVTGGGVPQTFPSEDETVKGYWDSIVVVSEPPVAPQTLRVDNDTDDHYVARDILYSWQESSDNIAQIKGYFFDLVKAGSLSLIEQCNTLDYFDVGSLEDLNAWVPSIPLPFTRASAALLPSDITVEVVESSTKIRASFVNASATLAGHEIQFHNDLGDQAKDVVNNHIRAKINPIYPEDSSGTFYLGWQNFPYEWNGAKSGGVLPLGLTVESLVSGVGLPLSIDVESESVSADTLGVTLEVVPAPKTEPLYVDLTGTAAAINTSETSGADFLLVEIDSDGTYHLLRPTFNEDGTIAGVDREDFVGDTLDVNGVEQIIEVAYRENRMDLTEYTDDTFSLAAEVPIKSTASSWNTPPTNVLWQKIRVNSGYTGFNRIQIRVNNQLGRQAFYRFYAYLVPANSGGLPTLADVTSYDGKTNPAGINTSLIPNSYSLVSCLWSGSAPTYDASLHRLWWETVELAEGYNDIDLVATGFTSSSVTSMSLPSGSDYYLGVVAVKVRDGLTKGATSDSWEYLSTQRPSMAWAVIDSPVSTFLPEKILSVRGIGSDAYAIEYEASDTPTHPAMYRVLKSSGQVVDSTYPKDMSEGAEIVVTWEDVSGETCTRIIGVTDRTVLAGSKRYAVFGFRAAETGTNDASIDYDYLSTSNGTVISGIDLADDAGYTRTAIDSEGENLEVVDSKTVWTDADWGITWAKRYGAVAGITISNPAGDILFDAPAGDVDEITKSAEAHLLKASGDSSFEFEVDFTLNSEFLDSEFYVLVLPSRYEGNVSDILQVEDGTPADFLILGFRHNGDIYLYRPNESNIVQSSLVRTLGSLEPYPWAANPVRIRVDNISVGSTRLAIWHGGTLIFEDNAYQQILPESDLGFWLGVGYRNTRKPSYTMRMEVGNFLLRSVQRNSPSTMVEFIHQESFSDVPDTRWFTYQGIEQVRDVGGFGSWLLAGTTRVNSEASYAVPHRLECPYNTPCRGMTAVIPANDSLNFEGNPDLSRFQLHVNIDDVTTIPQFGQIQRWVGPMLVLGKGVSDEITTTESIRWDANYESGFPEFDGESEMFFGIANFLPDEGPGTNTGVTDYEDYPVYSFVETDIRDNTRARIYALVNGSPAQIGVDTAQYGTVTPQFVMISFASDGKAYMTKASLNLNPTSDSSAPTQTSLGNIAIPGRGRISVIVEPTTGGGSVITGTLTASSSAITLGQSVVLSWTSVGATSITYSTGDFAVGKPVLSGSSTITPNAVGSHTYDIVFSNAAGDTYQASATVNVTTGGVDGTPVLTLSASPTSITAVGQPVTLTWTSVNANQFDSNTNFSTGGQPVSGGSVTVVTAADSNMYRLGVVNSNNGQSRFATVTVAVGSGGDGTPPTIASVTPASSSVQSGGQLSVSWDITGPVTQQRLVLGDTQKDVSASLRTSTIAAPSVSQEQSVDLQLLAWNGTQGTSSTPQAITVTPLPLQSGEKQYIPSISLEMTQNQFTFNEFGDPRITLLQTGTTSSCNYLNICKTGFSGYNSIGSDQGEFIGVATVPPPAELPPPSVTVTSAQLVFTFVSPYGSGYLYGNVQGGQPLWGQDMSGKVTGDKVTFDVTLQMRDWVNNLTPVSNVTVSMPYQSMNVPPYGTTFQQALCPSNTTGWLSLLASPNHPNANWRPYWVINFTAGGIQSVATVPAEGGIQSVASVQSTPTHCNVRVLVDDVQYAAVTNVPFEFFSDWGLRFFTGVRRKSPADRFHTSATVRSTTLRYLNPRSLATDDTQRDLGVWEKTDGVIPDNSLFYGRNSTIFQCEDNATRLVNESVLFAQTFLADGNDLRGFTVRVNSSSYGVLRAYICICNSDGLPSITPVLDSISATDANILGESATVVYPGQEEAFFVFSPRVGTIADVRFSIVVTGANSIYGTLDPEIYQPIPSYVWNTSSDAWDAVGASSAFRLFNDLYVNRANTIHGEVVGGRVAAVNNAGLMSDYTPVASVTVDLMPPHAPYTTPPGSLEYMLAEISPPTLSVVGGEISGGLVINYGRTLTLRIGAQDLTSMVGSGVWDYRIVYQDSFDQLTATEYTRWYDANNDKYVDHTMIYPGKFLTNKRFYAEIRDAVGNIARTNALDIEFKNAFYGDTEPPYLVRMRMAGDADLEVDPDEAIVVSTDRVDVTLLALDRVTGTMDVRLNHNHERTSAGAILYDQWRPYQKEFEALLSGEDGLYSLAAQARDFGYNSTLERVLQLKRLDYSGGTYTRELPTALGLYRPSGYSTDRLYVGTVRRTSRMAVEGRAVSSVSRTPYTAYEVWIGNVKQTFKPNETMVVRVNGTVSTAYTREDSLDLIVFTTPLSSTDSVSVDITEEVAVLYRFDGQRKTLVKVFDAIGGVGSAERAITSMCVYNGLLYIGCESGNIYTHNGVRTSLPVYRTLGGDDVTPVPVACMKAFRLTVDDQEFLYVGTYSEPLVFRYGGSSADDVRRWQKITSIDTSLASETNVFDIDVYADIIFVATGPNGKIFRFVKSVSSEGVESYTSTSTQIYADEFAADPSFSMDVLCLENFGGRIYAGVSHRSSIFAYELVLEDQPHVNDWNADYDFSEDFEVSPYPWQFYNDGISYSQQSENCVFTDVRDSSGKVTDSWVTMIGKKGSYCTWSDGLVTDSAWQNVNNATGWTLEFSFKFESVPATETAYQAVQILDGTRAMELRLYKSKMELVSGDESLSVNALAGTIPVSSGILSQLAYFQTSVWTTYRIICVGDRVRVYANGNNTPLIDTEDLFTSTLEGSEKSLLFGKTSDTSEESRGSWRFLRYYLPAALPPKDEIDRDFVRDQVIPFGDEIRYLVSCEDGLLAGVQPRDPSEFDATDDPSLIYPKTYLRSVETIPSWIEDSTYELIGSALTGGAVIYDGLVYSTCEVADDPLTATPINMRDFYTENPHVAMTRNGIVYIRRHTQAYDEIYKDTHAPDGAIIINENTADGGVRIHMMQVLGDGGAIISDGVTARFSPLNTEVDEANNVSDGDADTYDVIGTNDIRYLKQDFGGDGSVTKKISSVKWIASSNKPKTYRIEYLDPVTDLWVLLTEMIAVSGGETETWAYPLSPSLDAAAVRIYYAGDRETVSKDVQVTVSSVDAVIGTEAYQIGRRRDLSDSPGWVDMTDGVSIVPMDLLPDSENWSVVEEIGETLTAATVFGDNLLFGTSSGRVYSSEDGEAYTSSSAIGAAITCFAEHEDIIYLGTDDGKIYTSDDGGTWTLAGDTGEASVESLASFKGELYVGTGSLAKLFTYDGDGSFTLVRRFPSSRISALLRVGTLLYLGIEDSGQMFKYDGSTFTHIGDLDGNEINGLVTFSKDSKVYAAGDKGRLYSHDQARNDWGVLIDTSRTAITGVCQYVNAGPQIISINADGTGSLAAATYSYVITWVDAAGNESGPSEAMKFENLSPTGRARLEWRPVSGADSYRIYRSTVSGAASGGQKLLLMDEVVSDVVFYDDGTFEVSEDIAAPTVFTINELWFSGNSGWAYSYDGTSISPVIVPTDVMSSIAGVIVFKSNIYIWSEDGSVARFSGINVGSGSKSLWARFKDIAGNISSVIGDDILYNTLIENGIVEVDADGDITDQYSSVADPPLPIYGATKTPEQIGIYESEPYYSATLSKWDTVSAAVDLPPGTEVRLYIRTAASRDELDTAEWNGPYSASNDADPYYYSPYYGYYGYGGYEYGYEGQQYYETPDTVTTISHDISLFSGSWIQFKLVLVTGTRGRTPAVYSVLIGFTTSNSTEFFTTMFDLDAIANAERPQAAGIQVRRGLLTWQGTVPDGGEVTFGICTKDTESRDWSDYKIITPDQVFTVTPGGHFKIGIILVSTDLEEAVVDEFAIMLDTGERSVKINLHAYDAL